MHVMLGYHNNINNAEMSCVCSQVVSDFKKKAIYFLPWKIIVEATFLSCKQNIWILSSYPPSPV